MTNELRHTSKGHHHVIIRYSFLHIGLSPFPLKFYQLIFYFFVVVFVYVIIYYGICFEEIFGMRYNSFLALVIQCHANSNVFQRFPTENCFIESALFNSYSPKAK